MDAATISQIKSIIIIVWFVVVVVAIRIETAAGAATTSSFAIVTGCVLMYFESHVIAISI